MEQHPVPQHIASFQFKLFGNLTARQFITLAIPLTVAGFIFFSALEPIFVKYFLASVVGGMGVLVALVPVGGRPFDKWLVAFIKAVFAPTQRIWIKEKQTPEFLNVVIRPPQDEKIPEEITEKGRERLVAYLKSLPKDNQSPLDTREAMAISHIDFNVSAVAVPSVVAPIIWPSDFGIKKSAPVSQKKELEVAHLDTGAADVTGIGKPVGIRPFEEGLEVQGQIAKKSLKKVSRLRPVVVMPYVNAPKVRQHAKSFSLHGFEDRLKVSHEAGNEETPRPKIEKMHVLKRPRLRAHLASDGNFEVDNIISVMEPNNHVRFVRGVGKTRVRKLHFAPPANFDLSKLPIRGERRFEISEELKRRFSFEDGSPPVVLPNEKSTIDTKVSFNPASAARSVSQVLPKGQKQFVMNNGVNKASIAPKAEIKRPVSVEEHSTFAVTDTKKHLIFQEVGQGPQIIPLTDKPNVVSGLVTDNLGVPVEGAVLVIRDSGGIPVRALKANKLGQFLSATPLPIGIYTIEVESDLVTFKAASININGNVVPPLGLKGEAKVN